METSAIVEHVLETERERQARRLREIEPLVYTVAEMAHALNISSAKAYNLIHIQGFPSFKVCGKYLISREGLRNWVEQQAQGLLDEDEYGG